jgi:hypothetical protein
MEPVIHKLDADKAAKLGDLLFRYMRVRFSGEGRAALAKHELGALIAQGKQEFDEIYIELNASRPLCWMGRLRTCSTRL